MSNECSSAVYWLNKQCSAQCTGKTRNVLHNVLAKQAERPQPGLQESGTWIVDPEQKEVEVHILELQCVVSGNYNAALLVICFFHVS
jgi:hypothetical protein